MSYKKLKRVFDLLFSIVAILFLAPVILFVALLVRVNMGRPIIFSQLRPGLNGKPFMMYKFRTMLSAPLKCELSDEERITSLGRFLRATSLDELPELINVIRGNMSLIGPRPLLIEYLDKYSLSQMRRHEVLPGISGLAQIKGRNNLSWNNKFRYDVFYVNHIGWRIDLLIFLFTIKVVLFRSGFRSHGEDKKFGN